MYALYKTSKHIVRKYIYIFFVGFQISSSCIHPNFVPKRGGEKCFETKLQQ